MARKLPVAIEVEEFGLLCKKAKAKFRVAFLLGFASGLRLSEIVGGYRKDGTTIPALTKEMVKLDERKITIIGGKGDVDRTAPLPKGFGETHLKLLPLNQGYKNIASARRAMQKAFKSAAKGAGLLKKKPTLHFHSLRHGFGTQLANKGTPVHIIRDLMGHSSISTTNVYLRSTSKEALEAYEKYF